MSNWITKLLELYEKIKELFKPKPTPEPVVDDFPDWSKVRWIYGGGKYCSLDKPTHKMTKMEISSNRSIINYDYEPLTNWKGDGSECKGICCFFKQVIENGVEYWDGGKFDWVRAPGTHDVRDTKHFSSGTPETPGYKGWIKPEPGQKVRSMFVSADGSPTSLGNYRTNAPLSVWPK